MIVPKIPSSTAWPPALNSSDQDGERREPAVHDLVKEDLWVRDFMQRLKATIDEIVGKK